VFHNTRHTCTWLTGDVWCLSYWCVSGQCLWGTSVFKTRYSYKAYDGNYKNIKHLYFLHIMTLPSLSCISHTNNKKSVMKNFVLEGNICCEVWGSHSGVVEDSSLLGCHPLSLGELLLMFLSIKECLSSRLLTLDEKRTIILQNVMNNSPSDTVLWMSISLQLDTFPQRTGKDWMRIHTGIDTTYLNCWESASGLYWDGEGRPTLFMSRSYCGWTSSFLHICLSRRSLSHLSMRRRSRSCLKQFFQSILNTITHNSCYLAVICFWSINSTKQHFKIHFLPQRRQCSSITRANWLTQFKEIISLKSEVHKTYTYTVK
jgi:hypothetical protein